MAIILYVIGLLVAIFVVLLCVSFIYEAYIEKPYLRVYHWRFFSGNSPRLKYRTLYKMKNLADQSQCKDLYELYKSQVYNDRRVNTAERYNVHVFIYLLMIARDESAKYVEKMVSDKPFMDNLIHNHFELTNSKRFDEFCKMYAIKESLKKRIFEAISLAAERSHESYSKEMDHLRQCELRRKEIEKQAEAERLKRDRGEQIIWCDICKKVLMSNDYTISEEELLSSQEMNDGNHHYYEIFQCKYCRGRARQAYKNCL